jgi:hypothetical protein
MLDPCPYSVAEPLRYPFRMQLPSSDRKLVHIVEAALADATQRSGEWLVCRPGCTQCCVGAFAINQLDAVRLQQGLADLEKTDQRRANCIRERARASLERLSKEFPGDVTTGVLDVKVFYQGSEEQDRFAELPTTSCAQFSIPRPGCATYTMLVP